MSSGRRARRALTVLGAGAALLWLALPLFPIAGWILAERWSHPALVPQEWGVRGWREAASAGLGPALGRSLILALAVTALATPLGAAIGWVLGWRLTRHPGPVIGILLLPVLLPPVAVALGFDAVLVRTGLPEPVAVLALLTAAALPYVALTTAVAFARTPPILAEQARALGAGPMQAALRALLPALRRSLLVAALLAFLVAWSDYVITVLVGGGRLVTAPVLLGSLAAGSGNTATVAVIALTALAPPLLLLGAVAALTRGPRPTTERSSP
ncbi:ABC transporter permease [Serinibacter salmoneus]|uniref:Putative spermidine/putrescine transport system permease protein n=1 Tax=Serinibacter salmoneus TaxID=556530 RepID=A0A2A9CYD6_9MICO|nr:ABC transporter permease [Serinibacter salmoneus]PFG19151.1 putative spermidine/putrescine transport system permease protein [Serinibacter salmoneus]